MIHLIVSREYPPAAYPPGGIGTYAHHLARLLAEAGETVHVIGERWTGADRAVEESCNGRLIVHRVPLDRLDPSTAGAVDAGAVLAIQGLARSAFPSQAFGWNAGLLAERLVATAGIDLIEGQDWEAPLYYFQLRRALGLGPTRQPPCFVHLHSPTEFIYRYNDWDLGRRDYLPVKRQEDYSITAADAYLCPSRYLARQCERHYGLGDGTVEVIPYPIGSSASLERPNRVWDGGTICYVGRIEPRKGIIEWVDAAASVARDHPDLEFEFIGADTACSGSGSLTVRDYVQGRIPPGLSDRFHFRGVQPRSQLPKFLAQARLAVVPSRWENFPNTCIEAMASGLPVLASPTGGMAEMLEDGVTGWIARSQTSTDLAAALRRALAVPGPRRAAMGAAAAAAVRRLCDNDVTVRQHIELRARLAAKRPTRSIHLAPSLVRSMRARTAAISAPPEPALRRGIALVCRATPGDPELAHCLASIAAQTETPDAVVLVVDPLGANGSTAEIEHARERGWQIVAPDAPGSSASWNAGLDGLLTRAIPPLGISCVESNVRLDPEFVARSRAVLERCPEVGLVSFWTNQLGDECAILVPPCPAFPYQWVSNDVAGPAVIRAEALADAGPFRAELQRGLETWDVVNAVLASGWVGVTYPAVMVDRHLTRDRWSHELVRVGHDQMRRALLERFPDQMAADAAEVALLLETTLRWTQPYASTRPDWIAPAEAPPVVAAAPAPAPVRRAPPPSDDPITPAAVMGWPLRRKLELVGRAVRNPRYAVRWIGWHGRQVAGRLARFVANRKRSG